MANPNQQHYAPPTRPAPQAITPTSPQPQFNQPQSVLSPPHQPPMPGTVYGQQQPRGGTPQRNVRVITPQQFSKTNAPNNAQNLHAGCPQSELFWTPPSSPTRQPAGHVAQPVQQAVPHPGSGTHAPAMVANPLDTQSALGATDIAK